MTDDAGGGAYSGGTSTHGATRQPPGQHSEPAAKAAVFGAAAATRSGVQRIRRLLRRDGAGSSGLATLVELCAINSAGDALVAVALAGTVFFNVPVGQARGKVALYLLITMAPFALLAPVIGPALDKLHGRRIAMSASMIVRALLCYSLADHHTGLELYPLALGLLVTSRAFGIARAAVTPRVLPHGTSLLSANSRVTLVGAISAGVIAPPALGLGALVGIGWVLRIGTIVFLAAIVLCLQLPAHVDTAKGETAAIGLTRETLGAGGRKRPSRGLGGLPTALRAVMCMRALVGFLTLFLAFELRTAGSSKSSLAGLAAAALFGQMLGVTIGNRLGRRRPELLIATGLMLATAICIVGAFLYSRPASLFVALIATLGASLAKLGLDAIIQRDIGESSRASAFARSETALQLSWVIGGAIGLAPISGNAGLAIAAAGMTAALASEVWALIQSRRSRERTPVPDVLRRRQEAAAGYVADPAATLVTATLVTPTQPSDAAPPPSGGSSGQPSDAAPPPSGGSSGQPSDAAPPPSGGSSGQPSDAAPPPSGGLSGQPSDAAPPPSGGLSGQPSDAAPPPSGGTMVMPFDAPDGPPL